MSINFVIGTPSRILSRMSSRIGEGVTHLVALLVPLDGCSAPYSPIELGDEKAQVGVDNAFCGENFLKLAVVGRPAHPFRLGHIVAYAAIGAELPAQFERAPQKRDREWFRAESDRRGGRLVGTRR
jgi:hypothetical protein